jgi:hypothetical protein
MLDYKEFLKNPIVGLLFMCVLSIGYLYFDNKAVYKEQIIKQERRIESLETANVKKDSIIISISTRLYKLERDLNNE